MAKPFEGEDAKFFEQLVRALPAERYADHREHILRMLHSSPHPEPWDAETTMLRMGMRRSADSELHSPQGAARVIVGLLDSLETFMSQGDPETMELLFFDMLSGMATHPQALAAFSSYASKVGSASVARGRIEVPAGSDASEAEEARDPGSERVGSDSEFETGRGALRDDDVEYLSTGEAYLDL